MGTVGNVRVLFKDIGGCVSPAFSWIVCLLVLFCILFRFLSRKLVNSVRGRVVKTLASGSRG